VVVVEQGEIVEIAADIARRFEHGEQVEIAAVGKGREELGHDAELDLVGDCQLARDLLLGGGRGCELVDVAAQVATRGVAKSPVASRSAANARRLSGRATEKATPSAAMSRSARPHTPTNRLIWVWRLSAASICSSGMTTPRAQPVSATARWLI
jgi:hypothetical protein